MILAIGDRILFYTDGLVEAHNSSGGMLGSPGLKSLLQEQPLADGLIDFMISRLRNFTGADWEQEDDMTLVVLRKSGETFDGSIQGVTGSW